MEENSMSISTICGACNNRFKVTNVTHKKEFIANGNRIFLTYYNCPFCGHRHIVQIDDVFSISKLNEIKKQFVRMSKRRLNDKSISEKQSARFKKARQYLYDYRINLMKQFTGALVHDNETDSDFELRFSMI